MTSPFKMKKSPLKQHQHVSYTDSLNIYNAVTDINTIYNTGNTPSAFDFKPITNVINRRSEEGLFRMNPVIESGVTIPRTEVTNYVTKPVTGVHYDKDNVLVSDINNLPVTRGSVTRSYTNRSDIKNVSNIKLNRDLTLSVTQTRKNVTEGYVFKKPKMPIIKIDPTPAPPATIPFNTDVHLLGLTMPINRERKSGIGRFFANVGGLIPKLKVNIRPRGIRAVRKHYRKQRGGGGFLGITIKNKGNYQGSLYKKLTEQQKITKKSNIKIKRSNIEKTKYNITSAEKHISKYKDLYGVTYKHSFGGLTRENKAIRRAGFSEENVK